MLLTSYSSLETARVEKIRIKKQYTVHQQDTFKNHSSLPKHKQKTEIN